jgi:hypothetical protein
MTQTRDETGTLTQPVARFVALGLFLMAFPRSSGHHGRSTVCHW